MRLLIALLVAVGIEVRGALLALPLQLDAAASSLTTELCVQSECDSDRQPLEGTILLTLPCSDEHGQAALLDFHLVSRTNHSLHLDFGFGGEVTAQLSNLVIYPPARRDPAAFVPIQTNTVTYRDVPSLLSGQVVTHAEGLACVVVQLAGLKCDDQIDLSSLSTSTIDSLSGKIEFADGEAILTASFEFATLLSESQPEIGTVSGRVEIVARGDFKPLLELETGEGVHELRWCPLAGEFSAENAESLGAAWSPVAETPEVTPTEVSLTLTNTGATRFYRLLAPSPAGNAGVTTR